MAQPRPASSLVKQILTYAPGVIVPAVLTLLSGALFTRVFGAEEYGLYNLALSAVLIATALSAQWMQQAINRYLPSATDEATRQRLKREFAVGLWWIVLVLTALGAVSLPLGELWLDPAWQPYLVPCILLTIGTALFAPLLVVLQAEMRPRDYSLYNLLNHALKFLLSLALVYWLFEQADQLLWGAVLGVWVLIPLVWRRTGLPVRVPLFDAALLGGVRQLLRYGLPMVGWFLAANVLNLGARFVISWARGDAEVGIYSANYTLISGAVGLLSTPVLLAVHPFLMRAWGERDREAVGKWLGLALEMFWVVGTLMIAFTWLFSSDFALWFLGPEFREGHGIMAIVIAGIVVWNLGLYAHKPLEFLEKTRVMLLFCLLASLSSLGLNIWLVPEFGYQASAWATLFAYALYTLLAMWYGQRLMPWRLRMGKLLGSVAVTALCTWGLSLLRAPLEAALGYWPTFLLLAVGCLATALVVIIMNGYVQQFLRGKRGMHRATDSGAL